MGHSQGLGWQTHSHHYRHLEDPRTQQHRRTTGWSSSQAVLQGEMFPLRLVFRFFFSLPKPLHMIWGFCLGWQPWPANPHNSAAHYESRACTWVCNLCVLSACQDCTSLCVGVGPATFHRRASLMLRADPRLPKFQHSSSMGWG